MKKNIQIAKTLIEALPYIKKFNSKTIVLKYGGSIGSKDFSNFATDLVLMKLVGINPIVVHGGGIEINKALKLSGIESEFINGLRITCDKSMKIVEKTLISKVNKEIVLKINYNGGNAIGVSGKDNQLLKVKKLKSADGDLGRVGEIIKVNTKSIKKLQDLGYIPVVAPIGCDNRGVTYNINADHVASKVASSIKAEKLIVLTNVSGISGKNGKLISSLSKSQANSLIKKGIIKKGMLPKVKCLVEALSGGVAKAHIIDGRIPHAVILETFTDAGIGTEILL
ncbi:MAG: acetylglutamate kinase [Thermodesulfobacteriota bacterium]|nr:acetylglutamate kinase [Thermodesulfobacteriota bacterium]|tara:strand:- start:6589 stop:7434 length:846 start_codon:yes stop_codon:yes gene_type:complete